jgi:hypothetical protein
MVGGVVLTANQSTSQFEADATGDNMRRIYAYPENQMNKDGWGDDEIYIRYKSSSNVWSSRSLMTLSVTDHYLGILFADVPNDAIAIEFFTDSSTTDAWRMTNEITLNETNLYQGFKIIDSYTNGKVNVFQEKIVLSALQFSGILFHINSCSPNFASGFNSYEQIIKTFIFDSTQIMIESERANLSTTTYLDMTYSETYSTTTNRNLVITIAQKLNALRVSTNTSRSTSFTDIGGYRELVIGGDATQAGWSNNATSQKLTYSVNDGKYTFTGLTLSAGDFRILTFGTWSGYNAGYSSIPVGSIPNGFSNAGADDNIRVSVSGAGTYNIELSFGANSSKILNFVKTS